MDTPPLPAVTPPHTSTKPRNKRRKNNTTSVMGTIEEFPSEQAPRTQMLPVTPTATPPQSPPHNYYNQKCSAELPAKTMMLPPTGAPPTPVATQRTQMLPVQLSPKPSREYFPYNPPAGPPPSNINQPPPTTPPPRGQYHPPAKNLNQNMNTSVGAAFPVAQLPAVTAPTHVGGYKQSAECPVKKSKDNDNPTVDGAEVSDRNRRKEVINGWIRQVLTAGIEGLRKEYKEIPNGGTIEQAQVFHNNPTRNRYVNIPCCDATRVKLDGDPNFYIHANVVSSAQNRRFICAQAPLNGTVEEFWKMIIFSGLEYIVMLCEFVETGKPKSAVYFPAKVGASMKVGKLCTVTKVASESLDKTLTLSTLRITKKDKQDATLTVKHIHWHNWPDHGVPDNFISPLRLLNICKNCTKPIVVHCSAGVGRTGTLVLIFIILESLRLPEFSGVPRLLEKLRDERFKSIQTEMQYIYVHRCILEYLVYKKYQHSKDDYAKFVKEYRAAEKSAT
ncbi:hypothetical protein GCK72_003208 [Caenorhabditis remanei]|uniref:Uncharacterized protein n=1 Tax=Caenorhabditis remanei TaxID=31234 RepID=A0A6A5HYL8_CAERE|nr:hypothetical protein GCK72_003208 [Caenorhabditis remanei]KAF1771382.1 hypothetical protein GCK72_003208 [Caenorhabditis remanei]